MAKHEKGFYLIDWMMEGYEIDFFYDSYDIYKLNEYEMNSYDHHIQLFYNLFKLSLFLLL